MARKLKPVKCMEYLGRWHAITKRTHQGEESSSVRAVCGTWVATPAPMKRSLPDCSDCLDTLYVAVEAILRSAS